MKLPVVICEDVAAAGEVAEGGEEAGKHLRRHNIGHCGVLCAGVRVQCGGGLGLRDLGR